MLVALLAVGACTAGTDRRRAELCADLIGALEPEAGPVEIVGREPHGAVVRIEWRAAGVPGAPVRWLRCRFPEDASGYGRFTLEAVVTDRDGELSAIAVFLLREYWLGRGAMPIASDAAAPPPASLYAAQQAINALTLGALFGLIAVGYTLVWAVLARINLAFGQFGMVAGYATVATLLGLAVGGDWPLGLALPAALLIAAATGAAYALATERLVFRPLAGLPTQAPLIATAGLVVFLEELVRLGQGGAEPWLPAHASPTLTLAAVPGFPVTVSLAQLGVIGLAAAVLLFLALTIGCSRFGRAFRACCDDTGAAELCGVDVTRTVALTFGLAGASVGIGGFVFATYYGGVGFTLGTLIGFKALTAAVVGGLGSVGGAFLGGLIVGGLESLWAGYLALAYKDVAVFALLAAVLVFRPHGLLGRPRGRGD